jgi:hypothetical protein
MDDDDKKHQFHASELNLADAKAVKAALWEELRIPTRIVPVNEIAGEYRVSALNLTFDQALDAHDLATTTLLARKAAQAPGR